jgi:hypothetical protein
MVYGKIKRAFPWGKDESPLSRNKLDLRLSAMEERAGYLDRIRRLARSLQNRKIRGFRKTKGNPAMEMRTAFEKHMNNNLDYAGAFDAVANHLILTERKDKVNGITAGSRNKLLDVIRSADKVFGVLEI